MNKFSMIATVLLALIGVIAIITVVYLNYLNENVEGPMKSCAEMCKPHGVKRFQPSGVTREGEKWIAETHLMLCECQEK